MQGVPVASGLTPQPAHGGEATAPRVKVLELLGGAVSYTLKLSAVLTAFFCELLDSILKYNQTGLLVVLHGLACTLLSRAPFLIISFEHK